MHHLDDDQIFFKCPNCPATYNFKEFQKLDHKSPASPIDGPDRVGQATCRKCSKDFYYYLTKDVLPVVVDPSFPPDTVSSTPDEFAWLNALVNTPAQPAALEPGDKTSPTHGGNETDKMAQFEKAINDIDKGLSPPQLYKSMSQAMEIIIAESPPQIEAGFALLKSRFGLVVRDIEAFRKEVNQKREQIETDKRIKEFNAVVAKLSQPPKELMEDEKEKALAYLRDPNLFENISKDVAVAGEVVGEETNKMMLYLAATSRKFKKPISLVVFGKSSSGKSHVANAIAEFIPEEDSLILSSVSPKGFEYMGDQLKHRFILVQEWEGLAEALPTLRTLQSEGKLARLVSFIDPVEKTRRSGAYTQDCPCSVVVTTTKEGIHNENSTRIFELYADESVEQTSKVVRANIDKADMARRLSPEAKRQILDLHHNLQRLLDPVEVNIPFAEHLSFPAKTTRHRRDSERFINLIKAVAFLRQKQKELKALRGEQYIDAEIEDYRIAYSIGQDVIRATLNTISDRAKNALIVCCELNDKYLAAKKEPLFSVTEIQETAQKLGLDFRNRQDLYKQLDKLEEYEYLERKQARKNSTKYYKVCFAYERNEAGEIINIDLPDVKEILTPEQLQERLQKDQGGAASFPESQLETWDAEGHFEEIECAPRDEESEKTMMKAETGEENPEVARDPIKTTPGQTDDGKPFDFYVQEQVNKGTLRLERIRSYVLGTPRDLEIYLAVRKGDFIVDWFNKAPDKEYCREYWADLRIGRGPCGFRCPDCFLGLTHRTLVDPSRHTLYENFREFIKATEKWLSEDTRRNTLGLGTDSSDSLLYEGITGYARTLIPLFADPRTNPRNKHLLLLTKSANVRYLEGLPTRNVRMSFSLNPQEVADIFEGRYPDGLRITPSITDRLEASRKCEEMGFETRWRIDPIIPVDNWKDLYHGFFANASGYRPQRITLGLYRQMAPGLKIFSKKWGLEPMPWDPPMKLEQDEGVHGQLPRAMRVEIYKAIKDLVDEAWPQKVRPILALCKENRDVRRESGVSSPHCNCE